MDFSFYVAVSHDMGVRLFDIKYKGKRIIYEVCNIPHGFKFRGKLTLPSLAWRRPSPIMRKKPPSSWHTEPR